MVIENLTASPIISDEVINELVELTRIFQAIGGLVIAYIVFSIINLILNRRKHHELRDIKHLLEKIDKKLGKK